MTALLHRLGFSYKKAKLEPGRHPAPEVQEAFVEKYRAAAAQYQRGDQYRKLRAEVRFDDTIDAASTIALFQQLQQADPDAPRIIVICDNARYERPKAVAAYLTISRIQLEPLPPYCPNLNLIERFWTFFKRQVFYIHDYETFEQFRTACRAFFRGRDAFAPQLRTLLAQ